MQTKMPFAQDDGPVVFRFFKKTAEIQRLRATASIPVRVFSSTHVFRLPFLSVLVLKIISTVAFWQNRAALLGGSVIVFGAATISTLGVRAALRSAVRFRAGGKATEQAADCGVLKRRKSTGKFHVPGTRGPSGPLRPCRYVSLQFELN